MFLSTNAKFEPSSVKRNFCRSIWTVCTTCAISLLPKIMKVTKTSTMEREYSKITKHHQEVITKRKRKAPFLVQYTKIGKVIKRFRTAAFTDLGQWQFVLKLSAHLSSVFKSRKKHWPRCVKISCQKISATRKSPEGWPLTFWPKVRHVAPSFHLRLEYEVRSLYIGNIHSNCTWNNGLFTRHNDLDLQTGDLKLYVCLLVVLLYQAEYVLLNHNQKYGKTIAHLRNGSACL